MDKNLLRKTQLVQLDILLELDKICKKNDIRYFLIGGSALGAVRHKGFIPWDDDIDIGMFRDAYERFLSVCQFDLDDKYFLQTYKTEPDYPLFYAKIRKNGTTYIESGNENIRNKIHQGVFIDIFPLDNISDNSILAKIHFNLIHLFKSISTGHVGNYSNVFYKRIIKKTYTKIAMSFFSKQTLDKLTTKLATLYNKKKTKNIVNFFGRYGIKEMVPRCFYGKGKYMEFEGHQFLLPEKWDAFLTHIYNNYMKLPPVEEREMHNIYINLEKSYEHYYNKKSTKKNIKY